MTTRIRPLIEQPSFQLENGVTIERGGSGQGIWVKAEGKVMFIGMSEIIDSLSRYKAVPK
jgi:hypothetical protein